jgi:hypothetical protein
MDESRVNTSYEFSRDENLLLSALARELMRLGAAVLVAGILLVLYIVVSFLDPVAIFQVSDARHMVLAAVDYALWVVISLLVIYLSATVIRLAGPIRMITRTKGMDLTYLMDFVSRLTHICRLSFGSLIAICVLLVASLVMMILVF